MNVYIIIGLIATAVFIIKISNGTRKQIDQLETKEIKKQTPCNDSVQHNGYELEDWQLSLIREAKAKGLRGITMSINNNRTYVSFDKCGNSW